MKTMARRKITIEDLARMVKKGFDETARRDEVNEWQKWAAHRFNLIEADLKAIKKQLIGVVYRHEFEALQGRVKDLEDLLAAVSKRR